MWDDRWMVNFVVGPMCFRSCHIIFHRWYQSVRRYQMRVTWKLLGSAVAAPSNLVWVNANGPQSMHVYTHCMRVRMRVYIVLMVFICYVQTMAFKVAQYSFEFVYILSSSCLCTPGLSLSALSAFLFYSSLSLKSVSTLFFMSVRAIDSD